MEVDFAAGSATVEPAEGEDFDPRELRRAITEAGFSAPEVKLTLVGRLERDEVGPILKTPGVVSGFVLAGGEGISEIEAREELFGQRLRVTGELHPSHGGQIPGLTVEEWEVVSVESDA